MPTFKFFNPEGDLRLGYVSVLPPSIYQLWTPGDAKIAQLELLQVLIALLTVPEHFRGRRGYWYVDNTAALMALIRGRSDSPDLERLSHLLPRGDLGTPFFRSATRRIFSLSALGSALGTSCSPVHELDMTVSVAHRCVSIPMHQR